VGSPQLLASQCRAPGIGSRRGEKLPKETFATIVRASRRPRLAASAPRGVRASRRMLTTRLMQCDELARAVAERTVPAARTHRRVDEFADKSSGVRYRTKKNSARRSVASSAGSTRAALPASPRGRELITLLGGVGTEALSARALFLLDLIYRKVRSALLRDASVPIPKFATHCGNTLMRISESKDTSKPMILVPLLNPRLAIGLAAYLCELRVPGTSFASRRARCTRWSPW